MAYNNFVMMKYYATSKKDELDAALGSDNYCLQLKWDGAGYLLCVDSDGIPHLNNGRISKKTNSLIDKIENVPHIKQWAIDNMPPESQVAVEICYNYDWTGATPEYHEREKSSFVNSLMLAAPAKAIARQKQTENARAIIFDCLFWDGVEVYKKDFADRWEYCKDLGVGNDYVIPVTTEYKNKAAKIAQWLDEGHEGGVLKMLHSEGKVDASYHVREIGSTNARPRHTTYKIKEIDTIDVVLTRVIMPTPAYTGKDPENHPYKDEDGNAINRLYALGYANSFGIGVYNRKSGELIEIGTVASGMDDELRANLAADPDKYIGEVVELVCMSKDNVAYTLRHPRLIQFREDKNAEECTFEAIFN